jgi:hypothetical protein
MLLKNLNPSRGIIKRKKDKAFEQVQNNFKLINHREKYPEEEVLIPKITLCCHDTRLPFTLYRRQFPVIGAFAMIINKSQGQYFNQVDAYTWKYKCSWTDLCIFVQR